MKRFLARRRAHTCSIKRLSCSSPIGAPAAPRPNRKDSLKAAVKRHGAKRARDGRVPAAFARRSGSVAAPPSVPSRGIILIACRARPGVRLCYRRSVSKTAMARYVGKVRRIGRNTGRRSDWKKAYVALKEGDKIDFFGGA